MSISTKFMQYIDITGYEKLYEIPNIINGGITEPLRGGLNKYENK